MKTKFILSAVLSVGLLVSAPAFAKPHYSSNHDKRMVPYQYQDHETSRDDRDRVGAYQRNNNDRRYDARDDRRYDARQTVRDNRRVDNRQYKPVVVMGYGPRGDWHQGGRIDRHYNDRRYEVTDWQRQRLSAPPRGTRWVRVNNDYILASIATNLIFSIIRH